jgi:2-oxoglutarate dehydrogenase complex dehydrogenase (E1) component-like enzyme
MRASTYQCVITGRQRLGAVIRCCSSEAGQHAEVADTLRLVQLLQAFRSRGHLVADLDPLQRARGPWFTDTGSAPHCRWHAIRVIAGMHEGD